VLHRIYIFVMDTTEIHDELSRSAALRCAKSGSIAIKIRKYAKIERFFLY